MQIKLAIIKNKDGMIETDNMYSFFSTKVSFLLGSVANKISIVVIY
tara:strand:- start:154 stop:291 length:138 start_codon:yes stop_codon:yes gene_type:complete